MMRSSPKRRLAIVLDGAVYSAPTIQDKISGGRAVINGIGSHDEARDLAVALRAGALPAPVLFQAGSRNAAADVRRLAVNHVHNRH